jgi:hypothetical protein
MEHKTEINMIRSGVSSQQQLFLQRILKATDKVPIVYQSIPSSSLTTGTKIATEEKVREAPSDSRTMMNGASTISNKDME